MIAARAAACLLLLACTSLASAIEPIRPDQQAFLTRAVDVDGRLWLLSDAGELSSIAEGAATRVQETLPEPVQDICVHDGHLLVATCGRDDCRDATLRRLDGGNWSEQASFRLKRERIIALACAGPTIAALTSRRLIDLAATRRKSVRLSESLDRAPVATVHATADSVYVGLNAGEWGGGLRRIDRRTGKVTLIERNASGELCGGPLNSNCDPVTGIADSPWHSGCIAVAIGLVHMLPHGRIVEVCDGDVQRRYFKEYPIKGLRATAAGADEPASTTAFFGLVRQGDALWASAIDGLHRIGADGTAEVTALPEFVDIGGVQVAFDLPGVILVLTRVNQRRSVSGAVPMLVPRQR